MKKVSVLVWGEASSAWSRALKKAQRIPVEASSSAELAPALNRALGKATGDLVIFVEGALTPGPGWLEAITKALETDDLVVGETRTALPRKPEVYDRLEAKLFQGHGQRTSQAKGHAFPWGSVSHLGIRREWIERVGPFSQDAGLAFDIDFCWRAVLAGARLAYAPRAIATRLCRSGRLELLRRFEGYGIGEAWLHRTYDFLAQEGPADPLLASVDAFLRLRHFSRAAKAKNLAVPLDEIAAAYASGMRSGWERPIRACALPRSLPKRAVSWWDGPGEMTIFVAGKGLTTLKGKPLQFWIAMRDGASHQELEALFRKLFRATAEEAHHGVHELTTSLTP